MSDPFIIIPGATLTFTAGQKAVAVAGALATNYIEAGDLPVDPNGMLLAAEAVAPASITLVRPAPTSGAVSFVVAKGYQRAEGGAATAVLVRDVYRRFAVWSDSGLSVPVEAVLNAPPSFPSNGQRWLIGPSPTGAWAGKANQFVEQSDAYGGWLYAPPPKKGDRATYNNGAGIPVELIFTGSDWRTSAPVASDVAVTPVGGISANNLQAALEELDSEKATTTALATGLAQKADADATAAAIAAKADATATATAIAAKADATATATAIAAKADAAATTTALEGKVDRLSTTVVGRLARFSSTGGAIGQSQITEDTGGNVTVAGNLGASLLQAPTVTAATGAPGVNGYTSMIPGGADNTGYIAFYWKDTTRVGYVGFGSATTLLFQAEASRSWAFGGNVNFNDQISIKTNWRMDSSSNWARETALGGVDTKFADFDSHIWRTKAGGTLMTLSSAGLVLGGQTIRVPQRRRHALASSGFFTTGSEITADTVFDITLTGGGGGGMGGQAGNVMGGGGAAGTTVVKRISGLAPSTSYTVIIGAGGAGGVDGGGNGQAGGNSFFVHPSFTIVANGGFGAGGGSGGTGSTVGSANFDGIYPGADGEDSSLATASWIKGGRGGDSFWGGGGKGGNGVADNAGSPGRTYGAGGGGGAATASTGRAGGTGGAGYCLIEWVV